MQEQELNRDEFESDPVRRRSPEWDFGVHWWRSDTGDAWPTYRVSWVVETGEVYAVENSHRASTVIVLGVVPKVGEYPYGDSAAWAAFNRAQPIEKLLEGWANERRSLDWVRERLKATE